ncbi:MAG: hypothetical protein ACTSUQ_08620, partial [Candidatus Freyarchaeota archaeon]
PPQLREGLPKPPKRGKPPRGKREAATHPKKPKKSKQTPHKTPKNFANLSPGAGWVPFDPALSLFAAISSRHIARCKMGKQSDYPSRKVSWKISRKLKRNPIRLNETDVEYVKEASV